MLWTNGYGEQNWKQAGLIPPNISLLCLFFGNLVRVDYIPWSTVPVDGKKSWDGDDLGGYQFILCFILLRFFFLLFGCKEAPFQDWLMLILRPSYKYWDTWALHSVIVLRICRIDSCVLDPSKPACAYKPVSIVKGLSRTLCDTSSAPAVMPVNLSGALARRGEVYPALWRVSCADTVGWDVCS